jgi:hypothetical protein
MGAAFANFAWFRAWDLDAIATDFELITDVPQVRVNTGVVLPLGPVSMAVVAQFGAERRNNARTLLEATRSFRIPAYGLLGLTVRSKPLWDRVELAGTLQNVTDLGYYDDVPRPDPHNLPGLLPREGINGQLTARATF